MIDSKLRRRQLLAAMLGTGCLPLRPLLAAEQALPVTPGATEGPFYPVEIPADSDNDLMRVISQNEIAPGQIAYVHGSVVDPAGTPIDGARVEIWQCDHDGVYHHPEDGGEPDTRFQGFGAMATDRAGRYHFRTLRPVPYTGRTPHIHYRVTAPGFARLSTQLYVAEEAERNARDGLYNRNSDTEKQQVTSAFRPADNGAVVAEFNIVLG